MIQPPSVGPMIGAKITAIATSENALPRCDGLECVEDDRLLVGLQPAAEQALQQPEHDQLRQAGGDAAQERADREHRDADQEVALAPDQAAEPARDRHHDAVGHQVGRQRPGRVVVARRQRCPRCGAALTLTMVVSRISMNGASVTAPATSHTLAPRPPRGIAAVAHAGGRVACRDRIGPARCVRRTVGIDGHAERQRQVRDPCRCR